MHIPIGIHSWKNTRKERAIHDSLVQMEIQETLRNELVYGARRVETKLTTEKWRADSVDCGRSCETRQTFCHLAGNGIICQSKTA